MNNILYHTYYERGSIIDKGCYRGRYYEIWSAKGHPNAYVSFPEGKRFKGRIPGNPHGGYTFMGMLSNHYMIGWDYAWAGEDFCRDRDGGVRDDGRIWTLPEIYAEVIGVIDELNSVF